MARLKIAVLFGGASTDHSISLRSAYSVLRGLNPARYEVIPIGITTAGRWLYYPGRYEAIADGSWEQDQDCCPAVLSPDAVSHGIIKFLDGNYTADQRIDLVFSVLHGKFGESGRIQGLCRLSGIPFLGSGPESSASCLDKMQTRLLLNKAGVKTASFYYFERGENKNLEKNIEKMEKVLPYPVFVKPASCSSSIGANIAFNRDELISALKIAFSHHHKAIAEETIAGRDVSCAVYESKGTLISTGVCEMKSSESAIDGNTNYIVRTASLEYPHDLSGELIEEIRYTARKAFRVMDCSGFARIDMTVRDVGIYCCKIAAMPGFTEESVFFTLMKHEGMSYGEALDLLIENSLESKS